MKYKVVEYCEGYLSRQAIENAYIKGCENTYLDMFRKSYTNFNYDKLYKKYCQLIIFDNIQKEIENNILYYGKILEEIEKKEG